MTAEITADALADIIENAGLDLRRDYSGRSMNGKQCIGAVTDDLLLTAMSYIVECCEDCEQAARLLRTARTDNLGRGTIIYWPRVQAA